MSDTQQLLSHFYLKLDGSDAPLELMRDVLEITVESSLHLPDVATIQIHDSDPLKWVDDDRLEPGKKLVIEAKVGRERSAIFDGEIVELEPEFSSQGRALLRLRAFDRMHRLARGRHVRSFQQVTDGDMIMKIAKEAGLKAVVGKTTEVFPYVFQANETDLEFIRGRASALGYLLFMDGETLHCEPPDPNASGITLKWGEELAEFRPRISTQSQVTEVKVRGWDPKQRREIVGQATDDESSPKTGVQKKGGALAQAAFGKEAPFLVADRPIRTQTEATQLAKAVVNQHASSFIEAEGVCGGNPKLVAGTSITISNVGTRFSGTYLVTSVQHLYAPEGGYTCEFSISGLNSATLLSTLQPDPVDLVAHGLVVGIVTDNQDPEDLGRVKVKYPWLAPDHQSDWARVVAVGAGPERGIEYLPEVNDEVLVGFELGDIHAPYVLGGLWNGKDLPPEKGSAIISGGKVQKRIIRSRTGHVVTLDDTDGAENILIEDKSGNIIKIDSPTNDLTIEVKGNMKLKAQGNISIEATGQFEAKGLGATIDAGSGMMTAKGMGAAVDGGASMVDVKGMGVNVNGGAGPVDVKGVVIKLN